jgi:hypothetical protein
MSDRKLALVVDFVGVDKMSATTRTLSASSKAAAQQIGALRTQVGNLNRGLADAKALRAATEGLKKHKAATQEAAAKLAALKGEIKSGEAPTTKLVRQIQAASQNLTKMQAAEKAASDSARQMVSNMREAGVDVARLGNYERETATKIDQTTRALERQRSILSGTKARMAEVIAQEKKAGAGSAGTSRGENSEPDQGHEAGSRLGKMAVSTHGLMSKGQALVDIMENAADVGANFEALSFRLRALGLSAKSVQDLIYFTDHTDIAGTSRVDKLRIAGEAQAIFRETGRMSSEQQLEGAKLMTPLLAKVLVAQKAMGKEFSEDQEKYFLRVVEQGGGLSSPQRAAEITNGLFKSLTSSNGIVTPENFQTFIAATKGASNRLTAQSLFGDFEPIIAEMGERGGTGLYNIFKSANGGNKNQAVMHELIRLGAWDKSQIIFNKVDGVKAFKNGANPLRANLADKLATDPVGFYQEIRKLYVANGVKDIQLENTRLWGGAGGALFNQFEKMGPKFFEDARKTYAGTMGVDDVHKMVMDGLLGSRETLHAETENFNLSLAESGGALDGFTAAVKYGAEFMRWAARTGPEAPPPAAPPPVNWRSVNLSRPGGPMAMPTITPMRPANINPAFFQQPHGPVTMHVYGAPGQNVDELAKVVQQRLGQAQSLQARSTYNGGR